MCVLRVFAVCPACGRRVVYVPSDDDLRRLESSGIASVSFDHGDHVLVVFFDRQGRARGTEVHKFVSGRKGFVSGGRVSVEKLGLDRDILDRLIARGLTFVDDVLWFHPARLSELLGLDVQVTAEILERAFKVLEESSRGGMFVKSSELTEVEVRKRFLHSGSTGLDRILSGGFATGEVTELVGEYRTGKSQVCFTVLATVFLAPEDGGLNDGDISAVIIDSEHTFNVERLKAILERFDLDESVLDRILVGRPTNSIHQRRMINELFNVVKRENVKLVVVDSLTKLPRVDFSSRRELYDRQRLILDMVETLRRIARTYDIPILVTNQVTADPSDDSLPEISRAKPIGGHVLAHNVDTRLYLEYVDRNLRRVKVIDSSWLPPGETNIKITDMGIMDP